MDSVGFQSPQDNHLQQPSQPPKKKRGTLFWLLIVGCVVAIGIILGIVVQSVSPPSNAVSEPAFKANTVDTTIAIVDKTGNAGQNVHVHFTCTILGFVKDSNGNTAAVNVDDPNALGVVVQVAFPDGTDLSQLNTGDTLEVWGTDNGVSSGQNAFGATVQEVVVTAQYLTDQTTNYQTQ